MLRLYRRHSRKCPQKSERYRRCSCPIYVEGTLAHEYVRKALDLTSWEAATDVVRTWEKAGRIGGVVVEPPPWMGLFCACHPGLSPCPGDPLMHILDMEAMIEHELAEAVQRHYPVDWKEDAITHDLMIR